MDRREHLATFLEGCVTQRRRDLFHQVLARRTRYITLVLEDVVDPGDAGAVMRSCEIFGIQDMHLIARSQRFQVSKGVAVGSSKWVNTHVHGQGEGDVRSTTDCLDRLKTEGYRIVALSTRAGGIAVDELPLDQPMALCLANTGTGLSDALHGAADLHASIPTVGFTKTFNVSICAALTLAATTNRLHSSEQNWQLREDEQLNLRLAWLAKMPKRFGRLLARYCEDNQLPRDFVYQLGADESFLTLCRKAGF